MTVDFRADFDACVRAFAVARWHIGDGAWADMILRAYFDPDDVDAAEAIAEIEAEDG